ncbi:hypothetical protein Zm00014a_042678 [Zea mays]|jgi:hypothetical protein|uniref:Uncharacterized protein n=2 Tax=Zea mays TaxID=4577 RepID=B6U3H0_MAIZE|nr:uncharacterized protein LOC100280418 [Zea mays]ACG43903.1 hypothetical protein [Zea mays]ACL54802.1 unknown [Zea mays]AQK58994.1 hypothetical protein ZEAMMB73_Zm00001d053230 [Zea mays]PWZ26967.1 hypothetical protein Zm00014a_042678 [Zea mays]|eukprot:NP_001146813.1 uncharacterized protein LOC100280418 [Zea mays]
MADAQAPSPARFTARELAAAEQLIHLSESSSSSYAALPRGSVASASSTSSPRSVNAPPPPATPPPAGLLAAPAEDDEDDLDQQEVRGRPRRNRRYRLIAEIYAASEPKPIVGGARRRKVDRPSTDGAPEARK